MKNKMLKDFSKLNNFSDSWDDESEILYKNEKLEVALDLK